MNEETLNEEVLEFIKPRQPNFSWKISEDVSFYFYVKKTWFNKYKWWIATKLFLPGTYEWK